MIVIIEFRYQIQWVKAHQGNRGNERADALANKGALSDAGTIIELLPLPPLSKQRTAIKEF